MNSIMNLVQVYRPVVFSMFLALAGSLLFPLMSVAAVSGTTYDTPCTTTTAPTETAVYTVATEVIGHGKIVIRSMVNDEVWSLVGISQNLYAPKTTTQPNRIYPARELQRRADSPRFNNTPNPNHNFPESFNAEIFKGNRTVVSDNYTLYTKPGNLNGKQGVYEIGVRPSASGRTEVITHRFFRPDKN